MRLAQCLLQAHFIHRLGKDFMRPGMEYIHLVLARGQRRSSLTRSRQAAQRRALSDIKYARVARRSTPNPNVDGTVRADADLRYVGKYLDTAFHRWIFQLARNPFVEATLHLYYNLSLRIWYFCNQNLLLPNILGVSSKVARTAIQSHLANSSTLSAPCCQPGREP